MDLLVRILRRTAGIFRFAPEPDGSPAGHPSPGRDRRRARGIVAGAVATSAPGTTAISGGASGINEIVSFLTSNAQLLLMFAAAPGSELSWLATIAHLLDKLRRGECLVARRCKWPGRRQRLRRTKFRAR